MRARRPCGQQDRAARARVGRGPDGDPNVVEVYVGYLRRKLGAGRDPDRTRRRLPAAALRPSAGDPLVAAALAAAAADGPGDGRCWRWA